MTSASGAKFVFTPTALNSLPITFPALNAFSGSFVAPTAIFPGKAVPPVNR